MKRFKLNVLIFCIVAGCLVAAMPARCLADEDGEVVRGHFINEAILECCSTYVDSPDTGPHGTETTLYVGDILPGGGGVCRTFLKFQLPDLPPGSTITHAQLCLYSQQSYPTDRERTISVHYGTDTSWDELTAMWNNPPGLASSYNPVPTDSLTSRFWPGWAYWNVTDDVATVYGGGAGGGAYSVAVVMDAEPDYVYNSFYSKEQLPDPNYTPRLHIMYDPGGYVLPSGSECYVTDHAAVDFNSGAIPPIPAGFFGPGSDPFDEFVYLNGQPFDVNLGGVDTVINRPEGAFLRISDPCQVPVELVELNLKSTSPITVTFNEGEGIDSFFDVSVKLGAASPGQMTIIMDSETGGTFEYQNIVTNLIFTFEDTVTGETKVLQIPDPGMGYPSSITVSSLMGSWQTSSTKEAEVCGYDGFYPAREQAWLGQLLYETNPCGDLILAAPKPVPPQFALISAEEWRTSLDTERIRPMTTDEWAEYMLQFEMYRGDNPPYPDPDPAQFIEAQLSVGCPEGGGGGGVFCDFEYPVDGMLMVWGGGGELNGNYTSAWVYKYDKDPDLSNCVLTVTVEPPCGMQVVSLGLQDINGNIRAWYWNVAPNAGPPPPGMIQCSPGPGMGGTSITIDLTQTTVTAATPTANSYSSNPGFDIRKVSDITFDEDNLFIANTQAPTPDTGIAASWNYWYNLLITTKVPSVAGGVSAKYWVKWSQPPVVIDHNQPNLLLGWNEYSNYYWRPIVADDWLCTDNRPVTDIHWWGSFFWWTQPFAPPVLPQAFHIGIWTDIPVGVPWNQHPFSHPGWLIWENYCDNYVWSFAGYDTFPGLDPNLPLESCFQFNQLLSEDEWFYQDPNAPWDIDPRGTVYWLSIAAIYGPTQPWTPYQWGWKTRKPSWQDDAVVTFDVDWPLVDWPIAPPPAWPPTIGVLWKNGTPVEYPAGTSWDMAFELTTNVPDPDALIADLNGDGVVNFKDLGILAKQWLQEQPPLP